MPWSLIAPKYIFKDSIIEYLPQKLLIQISEDAVSHLN